MANKYVSTLGNDANTGTDPITSPWRHIQYACNQVVAGDTIFVLGGNYDEGIGPAFNSGTSWTNTIRLTNFPGQTPWLRPTSDASTPSSIGYCIWLSWTMAYWDIDGINCDGTNITRPPVWFSTNDGFNPNHIRFANARVIAGATSSSGAITLGNHTAIGATGSHQVINNIITGGGIPGNCGFACSSYGVYAAGPSNIIDGNDISDVSGYGIQVYNSAGDAANNNIVRNNYIHGITRAGDLDQCGGIIVAGNTNSIYNNVITTITVGNTNNANGGVTVYYGTGNKIWNTTIRVAPVALNGTVCAVMASLEPVVAPPMRVHTPTESTTS